MATKMETAIAALVIIAILVSAGSLYYTMTVTSQLAATAESVADLSGSVVELTGAMGDLAASMGDVAEKVGASVEKITAIEGRLKTVEETLAGLPPTPPTLTIIGPWAGKEMDAFVPVIDRFERLTGMKVNFKILRAEDLAPVLPAQFEAGLAPGDVIFMWAWFIAEKAKEGHIMDLTDVIDEATLSPGSLDPVKVDGKIYAGAYTGKVKPGFWYRKSFFEEHNLTPPTTWAEFLDLLDTIAGIPGIVNPIATGDGVGWPISDVTEHFLITFGGPQLHRDLVAGTVDWTSPQVRAIFEDRIVPLLEAGYFSEPIEWTTALELWWGGDYGLYFMGSWITGMVDDPEDLGVFSLPGSEGLVFGADYFFVPAYTKHPEEAKQLAQFLASAEAQRLQVAQGGHIATALGVSLDAYPAVDRRVAEVMVGKAVLADLDDTIGGEFQVTFWDQLKLLWVNPGALDDVLAALQAKAS
ncbi:MAG: ABC transporter substrate-binding protein [Candidatus Bathyarchaeia archaeon]